MTRANLNFVIAPNKVLYLYHNGDQYPTGLRRFYNVLDFIKSDWNSLEFCYWLEKNYQAKPETKTFAITGDNDKGTDYAYVFNQADKTIKIWNWDKVIFDGTAKEFIKWITEQD
jgi:hypothetical protein